MHGAGHAPHADRVDDEQLEVGEPAGEQHAPAREHRERERQRARVRRSAPGRSRSRARARRRRSRAPTPRPAGRGTSPIGSCCTVSHEPTAHCERADVAELVEREVESTTNTPTSASAPTSMRLRHCAAGPFAGTAPGFARVAAAARLRRVGSCEHQRRVDARLELVVRDRAARSSCCRSRTSASDCAPRFVAICSFALMRGSYFLRVEARLPLVDVEPERLRVAPGTWTSGGSSPRRSTGPAR